MKRLIFFLIGISLLLSCAGCAGSHKNEMTEKKWTSLKKYSEWFEVIYSKTDYVKDIQVFNFIERDKELIMDFDGDEDDIEEYFKYLINASNAFVQKNENYFADIERIQIVYNPAGRPTPIIISTYPESRLEELSLESEKNDNLELRYISIDGSAIDLNVKSKQKYNCKVIYLQDVIKKEKETKDYDLSSLNIFNKPEIIVLYDGHSELEEGLRKEIQKRFRGLKVIYR